MVKRDIVQNILDKMSTECYSLEQTGNSVESDPGQICNSPVAQVSSLRVVSSHRSGDSKSGAEQSRPRE